MSDVVEVTVPLEGESSRGNDSKRAEDESSGGGNESSWLDSIITGERKIKFEGGTLQIKKISGIFTTQDQIDCMKPRVVSLGPCHHGEGNLDQMEKEKKIAVRQFAENVKPDSRSCNDEVKKVIKECYEEVKKVTEKARESYAKEVVNALSLQEFTRMMFLDGCFMAYFIEGTNKGIIESELISQQFPLIVRDMFLFENQIPFVVLSTIMTFRFKTEWKAMNQIFKFITRQNTLTNFHYSNKQTWGFFEWLRHHSWLLRSRDDKPRHLFDIIRRMLLGPIDEGGKRMNPVAAAERYTPWQLGSVTELKSDGIGFGRSNSGRLTSARFVKDVFLPRILLPEIVIDGTTESQVINLIAFESCLGRDSDDMVVTSFIKFMRSLVRTAEDVKELRTKSVLYHSLCCDKEVADLFNKLPISNASDLPAYMDIQKGVMSHRDSDRRVAVARWSSTYFGGRWMAVTSIAAAFMIFLTAVQTIFSVFPLN